MPKLGPNNHIRRIYHKTRRMKCRTLLNVMRAMVVLILALVITRVITRAANPTEPPKDKVVSTFTPGEREYACVFKISPGADITFEGLRLPGHLPCLPYKREEMLKMENPQQKQQRPNRETRCKEALMMVMHWKMRGPPKVTGEAGGEPHAPNGYYAAPSGWVFTVEQWHDLDYDQPLDEEDPAANGQVHHFVPSNNAGYTWAQQWAHHQLLLAMPEPFEDTLEYTAWYHTHTKWEAGQAFLWEIWENPREAMASLTNQGSLRTQRRFYPPHDQPVDHIRLSRNGTIYLRQVVPSKCRELGMTSGGGADLLYHVKVVRRVATKLYECAWTVVTVYVPILILLMILIDLQVRAIQYFGRRVRVYGFMDAVHACTWELAHVTYYALAKLLNIYWWMRVSHLIITPNNPAGIVREIVELRLRLRHLEQQLSNEAADEGEGPGAPHAE